MRNTLPLLLTVVVVLWGCDAPDPLDPVESGEVPIETLLSGTLEAVTNPNEIAPLTAEIRFGTTVPAEASLKVLGVPGEEALEWASGSLEEDHVLPVLGLHPDAWNPVELRLTTESGAHATDTVLVATEPLPDYLPGVEILTSSPGIMEPGWTLADFLPGASPRRTVPLMFDESGAIRWYLDLTAEGSIFTPVERLANGNLVLGFAGSIREYDMLGRMITEWAVGPTYTHHHDVVEKPDGNLVAAVNKGGTGTIEDHIIELDRSSGEIVEEWDLRAVLDVDRTALYDDARDWLHVNSVWYDESDGGLIISGRHQGVFKVSAENELVWILAPHRGWGAAGVDGSGPLTSDFLLTAVDAGGTPYPDAVQQGDERTPDFDWPWSQHAAQLLPNGNILLFDNGSRRQFGQADPPPYSRGVEYEIDAEAMTVRQVWAYGRDRGRDFFASFVSDVDYLPGTGHRLIVPGIVGTAGGRGAWVTEVTSDGSVVSEAFLRFKDTFEEGDRFDIVYRAERLPIYPE